MHTGRLWIYLLPVVGLVAVGAGLSLLAVRPEPRRDEGVITLSLYCAAEARLPVEALIDSFQRRTGTRIQAHYGPSHLLLNQIESGGHGDLVLSADDLPMQQARERGLVKEDRPVACLAPVILVSTAGPHTIQNVADLTAPAVRLGLVSPGTTLLGRTTAAILQKHDIDMERLKPHRVFSDATGTELARAVALGQIDGAIVWRPLARQYAEQTRAIEIPSERTVVSSLVAAVLTTSAHPDAARQFLKFLEGNLAQDTFRRYDYAAPSSCDTLGIDHVIPTPVWARGRSR